jgi:replication initiation and membrane attachment protein DnaB
MLKSKVDKELFDFLCNEDVINIPDNYILSSTKFDEHYESKDNNIVLTKNINFEKFIDSMKNNRNKDFTKFSKRIISVLDQIHFLYQFDEPTLASIYEKSKGDSESETITKMNYNASVLSRKNKIDRVIVEKYDDNDSLIDNMNPNLIIEKYSNKYNDDLDIVNRILTNYNLPYGVINYLIMSLYKNKGDIPNYNYFEKVVKTIIKAGIVDANGAKLYFESAKKNYNNKGKVSASWVDDFIKNELGDFK